MNAEERAREAFREFGGSVLEPPPSAIAIFQKHIEDAVADEREACAALIENTPGNMDAREAYQYAAELIRARTEAPAVPEPPIIPNNPQARAVVLGALARCEGESE